MKTLRILMWIPVIGLLIGFCHKDGVASIEHGYDGKLSLTAINGLYHLMFIVAIGMYIATITHRI